MRIDFTVPSEFDGMPVHEILKSYKSMSSTLIKRIRLYGKLNVNGAHHRMIDSVRSGDLIHASFGHEDGVPTIRTDQGIRIYYQDQYLVVCEKPADLVTHPSWQHMDDSLIQRLSFQTLHPVMRLDRETSGLIVVALDGYTHHLLNQTSIEKIYLGVVYGQFEPRAGLIDLPIGRADNSIMIREVREDGRVGKTEYSTSEYNDARDISLVYYRLLTGRCHQIRVHSKHLGHPLVGDGLYGPASDDYANPNWPGIELEDIMTRQALHAHELAFEHPVSHDKLKFASPLPDDMSFLFYG